MENRRRRAAITAGLALLLLAGVAALAYAFLWPAAVAEGALVAGDPAPAVSFALDDGTTLELRAVKGPVIVYFYPKDATPGCTRQACAYRDRVRDFEKAGATVIGVSFDDAASHRKFREEHRLPFKLATDTPDGALARAFGVAVRTTPLGKLHARDTIVIGADKNVRAVLRGVDPVASVEEVLGRLKAG